jgi:DNA-binding response OmpR family regulator
LPGLDGIHALSELRRLHPGVATLLLSGNTPDDAISDALKAGVVDRYLAKPWRHNELQAALGELIRSAA